MNTWLQIAQNIFLLLLGAALHAALSRYFPRRKQPRSPSEQPTNQPSSADTAPTPGPSARVDPDQTSRADDASYALIQRLASLQPDAADLSQDVTLKAPDPVFEVADTPRESIHSLHVGEARADWAYAVDTVEASYPGKPTRKIESVRVPQKHADDSEDTAENVQLRADKGGQPS